MVTGEGELYQGNYRQKRKNMESSIEITGKLEIELEKRRWLGVFHKLEDSRRLFLFLHQGLLKNGRSEISWNRLLN